MLSHPSPHTGVCLVMCVIFFASDCERGRIDKSKNNTQSFESNPRCYQNLSL